MYSVDTTDEQILIEYSDIFSGEIPNLKKEIYTLNMHKSISIICELIRVRDAMLDPVPILWGEFRIPLEMVLKKQMCDIDPQSPKEMFSNSLLRNNVHIISVQMLLILLKRIIQYGNYTTLNDTEYKISQDDYKKIIQLQLVIVDEFKKKHTKEDIDISHFLYSTYHLNYPRNVAHEFLRMYYMMEKISRDKDQFNNNLQKQYRDYYTVFTQKYGFTPTQYSSLLFSELTTYYSDVNGLIYDSMWKDVEKVYGQTKARDLITQVIHTLSQSVENYLDWVTDTEEQEWDFSRFYEFPFMEDRNGKYISICDITLRNAFFEKIFWMIRDCYPEEDSRAMAFFGRLFEKYIQDITQNAVQGEYEYITEFTYKPKKKEKKSSDAYIRKGSKLLVVEAKGFSVLLDCMIKNEKIEKNNEKLFINPILQADLCLADVITDKPDFIGVESAYIVAVTMDNINAVPNYYNEIYDNIERNKVCDKTKYYFNFNIEEYEMLMFFIEQGYDIFELLSDYFNNEKLKPFSNYLLKKHSKIDMTTFMKKIYHEAAEKMKEIVFTGNL